MLTTTGAGSSPEFEPSPAPMVWYEQLEPEKKQVKSESWALFDRSVVKVKKREQWSRATVTIRSPFENLPPDVAGALAETSRFWQDPVTGSQEKSVGTLESESGETTMLYVPLLPINEVGEMGKVDGVAKEEHCVPFVRHRVVWIPLPAYPMDDTRSLSEALSMSA